MSGSPEHCADDPEKQKECRKKVLDASNYLLELVNDILDMNKLDSGELVWKDEFFLLPELLDSVVSLTKYQAAEHGITLHFTDSGIRNTRLFGGAVPLKRICLNLISNAVKYNKPNGTVDFTARQVSYDRDSGKTLIEFVCADTGIGMSEEFQKKMYEPFVQEDVSYHSTLGGTGLGLAIVRRLVDRMGGEISAVSEKNKGTTFTVRLPFLTEAVPPGGKSERNSVLFRKPGAYSGRHEGPSDGGQRAEYGNRGIHAENGRCRGAQSLQRQRGSGGFLAL